ncbi:MAG: N-acetylmuramoyl-L-alanine amidase [Acidaminococcaceae bacterium]
MRVCIDAGHDGEVDKGAIGQNGTCESDITLLVAEELKNKLEERGHEVVMTRDCDDVNMDSLTLRANIANEACADLIISLHCNGAENVEAKGREIFTSPGESGADPFATMICEELNNMFPTQLSREDWSDGDLDKEARFTVLTATVMPAVLVEMLFITNEAEEAMANDQNWQAQEAEAIARAVDNYAKYYG